MDAETLTMKDGDVFRWSYREPGDDRSYGRYHCCSNIGIFNRGRLRDTYWAFGSDGKSFGEDDLPKLKLVYLGNLSDLYKAREYEGDYYDDADIVDLNHPNASSGNFYLRNGAKRSAKKMLAVAQRKLEQSRSDQRVAARREEQILAAIARIEAGDIADVYL